MATSDARAGLVVCDQISTSVVSICRTEVSITNGGNRAAAVGVPDGQQPNLQSKVIPARLLRVERTGASGISAAVSAAGVAQDWNCCEEGQKDHAVAGVFSSDGEKTE